MISHEEVTRMRKNLQDMEAVLYEPAERGSSTPRATRVPEFDDVYKVVEFGAKKYSPNGWLEHDAYKMDHDSNHASMFRHLAASQSGNRIDESGLDHLLHLACRALMQYTRMKRGTQ